MSMSVNIRTAVGKFVKYFREKVSSQSYQTMNESNQSKCLLKSVHDIHPDIEITSSEPIFIGRTTETRIEDTLVSKKQINLRANFESQKVTLKVIGVNASGMNGEALEKNRTYTAQEGDIVEVLHRKYPYRVCFVHEPIERNLTTESTNGVDNSPEKVSNCSNGAEARKRKLSSSTGRFVQEERNQLSKKRKWLIDLYLDAKLPFPDDAQWESFNSGQLICYTPIGMAARNRIAAYDMDGTLIATQSGKVFPKDANDWKIAFSTVCPVIREKHEAGFKIVIMTNQAGVSKGRTKLSDLKTKIENIIKRLNVPVQVFIATGNGCFRKPLTGMWQALCSLKNSDIAIDSQNSFFVGDAAGRPENKLIKRKKDHSTVDRLMALNCGLIFFTPEQHFLRAREEKWFKPDFVPNTVIANDQLIESPKGAKIEVDALEVIVMVGGQGSGKSHFTKVHLEPLGYKIVSRDVLGTWQKCVDRLNDHIKAGEKVVVDNTNGTREMRDRYLQAAKKLQVPCRCFLMNTRPKHAEHNIAFRELINATHSKISSIILNGYRKNFEEPTLKEGFSEIVRVNCVPKFDSDHHRDLYSMYLLSS